MLAIALRGQKTQEESQRHPYEDSCADYNEDRTNADNVIRPFVAHAVIEFVEAWCFSILESKGLLKDGISLEHIEVGKM